MTDGRTLLLRALGCWVGAVTLKDFVMDEELIRFKQH